jgi:hypothetical protein
MEFIVDCMIDSLYGEMKLPPICWPNVPECGKGGYLCNFQLSDGVCFSGLYFDNAKNEWVFIPCNPGKENEISATSCNQTIEICWEISKNEETGETTRHLKVDRGGRSVYPPCPCQSTCW